MSPEEERLKKLRTNLSTKLLGVAPPLVAPFPPCADVLLSRPTDPTNQEPEIAAVFDDYFSYAQASTASLPLAIDPRLEAVLGNAGFPPAWCIAPTHVTLAGKRTMPPGVNIEHLPSGLKRLFIGDLVWLFFHERMGVFKILGAILDDFARRGKHPILNNDLTALILEAMVRQTKIGLSSSVRDRDSSYRRCLGWTSQAGRALDSDASVNKPFSESFHQVIRLALQLYRDRRVLADRLANPSPMTASTVEGISTSISVLQESIKPFDYGRNYSHTLAGIVWTVSALTIIRDLRGTLGIPLQYKSVATFFQAAYESLGGESNAPAPNRYLLHQRCAVHGRDLLLDLQVLETSDPKVMKDWLVLSEGKLEAYRAAYLGLTGIDLGPSEGSTPEPIRVEQQV